MNTAELEKLRDLMPFAVLLGIEVVTATPEVVQARVRWRPELCTAGGLMHGGVLMALADTCGGASAYLNLPAAAEGTATIESKTNFLCGVREGSVTATTRPLHRGRTLIVLETELSLEDDRLAAKVTQTQAYLYPRG